LRLTRTRIGAAPDGNDLWRTKRGPRMFRRTQLSLSILCISALLIGITAGRAFSLSDDQEKCVNGINKAGAKLAATQGKLNSGCVKTEVGGGGSTDACV